MGTSYPGALDTFTNPASTDGMNLPSHSDQHTDANDAIAAIQAELGTNPSGGYDTVKDRLAALAGGGGGGMALIDSGTFTAVSSLSLPDNVFSADYDDYRLIWVPTAYSSTTGCQTRVRFRASGSDETGSVSSWARAYGGASSGGSRTDPDTSIAIGDTNTPLHRGTFDILSPHRAEKTSLIGTMVMDEVSTGFFVQTTGSIVQTTTQYDSLTIYPSNGTFTGRWALYGYPK